MRRFGDSHRTQRMPRRWLGPSLVLVCLSGCFSYVPVEPQVVLPGENVRVYLTRAGLAGLTEFPAIQGTSLDGTLVEHDTDRLLVRVPIAMRQEGFHLAPIAQDVWISRGEVLQFERRRFDPTRSGILALGGAGLAAAVVLTIIGDSDGRPGSDRPIIEDISVPLLSIPIP